MGVRSNRRLTGGAGKSFDESAHCLSARAPSPTHLDRFQLDAATTNGRPSIQGGYIGFSSTASTWKKRTGLRQRDHRFIQRIKRTRHRAPRMNVALLTNSCECMRRWMGSGQLGSVWKVVNSICYDGIKYPAFQCRGDLVAPPFSASSQPSVGNARAQALENRRCRKRRIPGLSAPPCTRPDQSNA